LFSVTLPLTDPNGSPMPAFGTSGLRGLVTDLTPALVADYTRAFAETCLQGEPVLVGQDLRPSSGGIARQVCAALQAAGVASLHAGPVATPALALAAQDQGAAAIMVTGSHIPADRNGLKFYTRAGEITKNDESAILSALGRDWPDHTGPSPQDAPHVKDRYLARYVTGFGPRALAGLRLGVWQHSSVLRDGMAQVLANLGAQVIPLGRSEEFIPVDTEAVDPATRAMLADWCVRHALDALLSTDGDADRPLLTDAAGTVVPGDVLGVLTARALGAQIVVTPVSSNTMVDRMRDFGRVIRTRIGSPHVIAGMAEGGRVVGFEANGGFLLGFDAQGPCGPLPALMTRDGLLPIVATLAAARAQGSVADLVAGLPARFTASDRVQNVPTAQTRALLDQLTRDLAARANFFAEVGQETSLDLTDGLRVTFSGGQIVHLRPSGNAPECRCYAEADSPDQAWNLVRACLVKLAQVLKPT
jgi:phosphomannomutase